MVDANAGHFSSLEGSACDTRGSMTGFYSANLLLDLVLSVPSSRSRRGILNLSLARFITMGQGTPATDQNPDIELGHMPPESEFSRTPAPVLDELQKGQDAAARDCRTDLLSFKREPRFSRDGDMPVFGLYKSPAMILELRELYILKLRHLRIKLATEALGYRYSITEKCPDWADPDAKYIDSRAHDYRRFVSSLEEEKRLIFPYSDSG